MYRDLCDDGSVGLKVLQALEGVCISAFMRWRKGR